MGITVNQAPQDGQGAHFNLWHVVNTDLAGDPSLKCIFDIYINGILVTRQTVYPDADLVANAFYDASNVIRNFFKNYFMPGTGIRSWTTDDIKVEYTMKYGEQYTTLSGTIVTNANQATTTHKIYNCYPAHLQGGYVQVIFSSTTFITERDSNIVIPFGKNFFLPVKMGSGTTLTLQIDTYDESGTNIQSVYPSFTDTKKLAEINLSSAVLNAAYPGLIDDNVSYVNIMATDGSSNTVTLKLKYACTGKYEPTMIHFLNRFGGYESFCFGLVSKETMNVDKSFYMKDGYKRKSIPSIVPPPDLSVFVGSVSNFDSTTNVYHQQKVQYAAKQGLSMKLTSGYVSETDYNWLKTLIASGSVYLESNGYYYPVVVTTSTWEEKTSLTDKLFNLEMNIDLFDNIYSQQG